MKTFCALRSSVCAGVRGVCGHVCVQAWCARASVYVSFDCDKNNTREEAGEAGGDKQKKKKRKTVARSKGQNGERRKGGQITTTSQWVRHGPHINGTAGFGS